MMPSPLLTRREFLTLPLGLALAPLARVWAEPALRRSTYDVDVALLYNTLTFELAGTVQESVDQDAGRYEVRAEGQGSRIANRIESRGIRRGGRWAPLRAASWFQVAGRESRSEILYHYERRTIEYHSRGETFFLRRQRIVDDNLAMPPSHVDDVMTAALNFAEGLWPPESDGSYRTQVVRRFRPPNEGPDDVQREYRAELAPFALKVETDRETGRPTALFDLSRFSSWARESRPARIVFSEHRRPEQITATLMLGTSITIRLKSPELRKLG
jgi:hypothetical protein